MSFHWARKKNFLTIYEIYAYFTNTTEKLVRNIKETKHTFKGKVKGNFIKKVRGKVDKFEFERKNKNLKRYYG